MNRLVPWLAPLPPLFWAGNFVLARALRADIPPLALSFWRWALALAILLPFAWQGLRDLMPLFGALLALILLDERPGWFHGLGLVLIAGGIHLAGRRPRLHSGHPPAADP